MHHPTERIIHTTSFVIPVVEHWLIIGLGLSQMAVNQLAGIRVYTLSWLSKVNLRTSDVYIFKQYFI